MYKRSPEQPYYNNQHSCFLLQYHLILVIKYHKPVLTGDIKETVYALLQDSFTAYGCIVKKMDGDPDHINIIFDAPPNLELQKFINAIKVRTSRMARKYYQNEISKFFQIPSFWTDGYFIATIGRNTPEIVKSYFRNPKNYKNQ